MSAPEPSPTVVEVLRFEDLPLGSRGSRRAVVRWSDGTEGEALSWFADLCGHPRTSAHGELAVVPTWPWRPRRRALTVVRCSA
jgi:hypothetical protein